MSESPSSIRPSISAPDIAVAIAVTLMGILLLIGTLQISSGITAVIGPRVFPMIVSASTLLFGGMLLWGALHGEKAEAVVEEDADPNAPVSFSNAVIILSGFIIGSLILVPIGFIFGTALMYFSVAFAFGERRFALMTFVSLIIAFITYIAFTHGLGLNLPAGILKGLI